MTRVGLVLMRLLAEGFLGAGLLAHIVRDAIARRR
jgi:hypothetical protein